MEIIISELVCLSVHYCAQCSLLMYLQCSLLMVMRFVFGTLNNDKNSWAASLHQLRNSDKRTRSNWRCRYIIVEPANPKSEKPSKQHTEGTWIYSGSQPLNAIALSIDNVFLPRLILLRYVNFSTYLCFYWPIDITWHPWPSKLHIRFFIYLWDRRKVSKMLCDKPGIHHINLGTASTLSAPLQ